MVRKTVSPAREEKILYFWGVQQVEATDRPLVLVSLAVDVWALAQWAHLELPLFGEMPLLYRPFKSTMKCDLQICAAQLELMIRGWRDARASVLRLPIKTLLFPLSLSEEKSCVFAHNLQNNFRLSICSSTINISSSAIFSTTIFVLQRLLKRRWDFSLRIAKHARSLSPTDVRRPVSTVLLQREWERNKHKSDIFSVPQTWSFSAEKANQLLMNLGVHSKCKQFSQETVIKFVFQLLFCWPSRLPLYL